MDAVTLAVSGALYVTMAVARKAGDELVDESWARLRAAVMRALGRDPAPAEITPARVLAAVAAEPDLEPVLARVWNGTRVLRRAQLAAPALRGARVLWIDDRPEGCATERHCLTALGLHVTSVETTRSALACLDREPFDLILSDVDREGSPTAGVDALPALRVRASGASIVLYVAALEPRGVPQGAFGITARPDELLHLCMDALERRRL